MKDSKRAGERPRLIPAVCSPFRSLTAVLYGVLLIGIVRAAPLGEAGIAAATTPQESSSCGQLGRWGGVSYLDITQRPGVLIERDIGSRVDVLGARFPLSSPQMTTLSFEFFTYSERALLFHAESKDGQHEMTAWVDRGVLKVRLAGSCLWLKYDETLWHSHNITEGTVHRIALASSKTGGVRVHVDGQCDILFPLTSRVLSCWNVENFYFGGPGPKKQPLEAYADSQYSFKMMGCVRQLTLDQDEAHEEAVFSYRRASTCFYVPEMTANTLSTPGLY